MITRMVREVANSPAQLSARLETFLQFHEQKIAGIPGLNIIYESMPARITEKIVKGKDLVILKHTSCTVLGWELHTIDRMSGTGNERHLTRPPSCIFLKFQDADWIVDERQGKGIFPLHLVRRTWVLKEKTGAKVRRTGYTLLPDFAWTASMAQGMTLTVGLVDCGDVFDAPGLSDQMNVYVIL